MTCYDSLKDYVRINPTHITLWTLETHTYFRINNVTAGHLQPGEETTGNHHASPNSVTEPFFLMLLGCNHRH